MKHLIIYAHPKADSLNGQLKDTLVAHLQKSGHDLILRDLYELDFDPVLSSNDLDGQRKGTVSADVTIEQNHISWAECITFIYPIWWTGLPAILKGYIDRVFSYGFAYSYERGIQKGLLGGKPTVIINTHGKSMEEYHAMGMDTALALTSTEGIYTYCNLNVQKHFFFDKADRATADVIAVWKQKVTALYLSLSDSSELLQK